MKKRLLSALLALTLIVGLLPGTVWASTTITPTSGTCGDNINWYLQQDGTLLLDGSVETYGYGGYWFRPPAPWSELADEIKTIRVQGNITRLDLGQTCGNLVDSRRPGRRPVCLISKVIHDLLQWDRRPRCVFCYLGQAGHVWH